MAASFDDTSSMKRLLTFLSSNDIKDLVFLMSRSPSRELLQRICTAEHLITAAQTWYGAALAPAAIYQALLAANMPILAVCILNACPSSSNANPSNGHVPSSLRRFLFNVAVQFPDSDVPCCRQLLRLTYDGSHDLLDLMAQLLEQGAVTDSNIDRLLRLCDISPPVRQLYLNFTRAQLGPVGGSVDSGGDGAGAGGTGGVRRPHPPATDDGPHPMKNPICVILNVHTVPGRPPRNGSERDVTRLVNIFTRYNYSVMPLQDDKIPDLNAYNIFLSNLIPMLTKFDCLVFFVMSHGHENYVELADGSSLHHWDKIVARFLNGCLRGKPKIFFFQCCRGNLVQRAIEFDGPSSLSSGLVPSDQDNADLYVCHSTFDGFAAVREELSGSWFIQALCDQLESPERQQDLESIRMAVAMDLQHRRADFGAHAVNQTPVVEKNTLTRRVYLKRE